MSDNLTGAETASFRNGAAGIPGMLRRHLPVLLPLLMAVAAWPLVGSPATWLTLTIAGIAMGMMIFIMASGLTLVFGLMDVLNFGHGAFISLGAFVGVTVISRLGGFEAMPGPLWHIGLAAIAVIVAMIVSGAAGYVFERILVRGVYGDHLKQILITMGGLIIVQEGIRALWGPDEIPVPRPETLRGAIVFGAAAIEKYRLLVALFGALVFAGLILVLNKTRLGLLIRAGVENAEMVEALGYHIRKIFIAVFVAGSALAGLGGVMWGLYQEVVVPELGMQVMVLVFIVVIIGGLGSVGGCLLGGLMVGLLANYTGYIEPKLALISNIALMAAILLWRPQGLFPANRL